MYGYNVDRETIHVYLHEGEIYRYRYGLWGAGSDDLVFGPVMPAEDLVPSKRAYPQYTDLEATRMLAALGTPLCFTTWDQPDEDRFPLVGKTHLD